MERKQIFIIALMLLPALLTGCVKDRHTLSPGTRNGTEVIINGAVNTAGATRAQLIPNNGLPPHQLIVGVATLNYTTADPENDQPGPMAWRDATADWAPGYFGGPDYPISTPPSNGEIKYLREDLSGPQTVFYDENGEYYFVRVLHPFDNTTGIQTVNGLSVVFSGLDGGQDIMCSDLGWGNEDQQVVETGYTDDDPLTDDHVIVMSHMLSLFRIKVVAENATASAQYGKITGIRIPDQPASVMIDMVDADIYPTASVPPTTYYPVGFSTVNALPYPEGTATAADAGYVMALPASKFTIEALSENRLWLTTKIDFSTETDPYLTSQPGHVYDVTLKFMEAYELRLDIEDATDWWMDSVFD